MTELNQIYKCNVCGNVVELVHASSGELVCCGQAMQLLNENTEDAAVEKHVPVVERTDVGMRVRVGEVVHPMEKDHHIEWVEVLAGVKSCKKFLRADVDLPEAEFELQDDSVVVRAYCNLHGLWKAEFSQR